MTPFWEHPAVTLYHGDCREVLRELPAESVQCVVTSPPYWGLRSYGYDGQIGLEATPEEHVAVIVDTFREVRRVMRKDATLWLNYGDAYLAKQLLGIPWRVAFALQADGWWLRQDIVWAKPNPMPESVTDRCTKAHEYLFLLSRSASYYYDADAIREESIRAGDIPQGMGYGDGEWGVKPSWGANPVPANRNKRSVWTIPTAPFSEAHFATFPPALVEPCVLAGTSEAGCCADCGAPRERVTETTPEYRALLDSGKAWRDTSGKPDDHTNRHPKGHPSQVPTKTTTTGWRPTCSHEDAPSVPCVVLDPFSGSGTTAMVARDLGRRAIGIDASAEYLAMAVKRIGADVALPL